MTGQPPPARPTDEPRPDPRSIPPAALGLAATAVLLLAALVSVALVRAAAHRAIDLEVRSNLARLAEAVAATVKPDLHAALQDPAQEGSPTYERLNQPLRRVITRVEDVRFVYTLRREGPDLRFVLDGTPPGDADGDGVEDHSALLEVYEDPDPAAFAAFDTGRTVVTPKPYTDAWGTYLSGFAPVFAPDGSVECVVGVDVSAAVYADRLAGVDRAALIALVPTVLICAGAGVMAWWVARRFTRHAREIDLHREQAERANQAKSVLLANISHELRTPLTAISGFVAVTMDDRADARTRLDAGATIRQNADHLLSLIDDLLDMSKAEAGAIMIEPAEVDARELVRTAASALDLRAAQKGIALEVVGLDALPARAVLDPTRVRQVLLNLLGNAVKFTDRGRVVLRAGVAGDRLVFRVEDTGPGMDAEQMSRLFQPFSQVGAKRREGTGLGLAISRHLAELMGGRIDVESTPGRGSVFTAEIPFAAAAGSDAGPDPLEGACVPAGGLSGRLVLVADDGADNRRLLRYFLGRAGARVEDHPDGAAARDAVLADPRRYDLVITDWDMPILDGPGLVRALRDAGWRGPIVSLTAHAMAEQEQACLDAGCDAHLTKPIDAARLIRVCAELIDDAARSRRAA